MFKYLDIELSRMIKSGSEKNMFQHEKTTLAIFVLSARSFVCMCYRTEPLGKKIKKQSLIVHAFDFLILHAYRHSQPL